MMNCVIWWIEYCTMKCYFFKLILILIPTFHLTDPEDKMSKKQLSSSTPCTCTQWGRIGFNPSVVWDEDVLCYIQQKDSCNSWMEEGGKYYIMERTS